MTVEAITKNEFHLKCEYCGFDEHYMPDCGCPVCLKIGEKIPEKCPKCGK